MATYRFKFDLTETGEPVYSKRIQAACDRLGIADRNVFALIATKMAADLIMQEKNSGDQLTTTLGESARVEEARAEAEANKEDDRTG